MARFTFGAGSGDLVTQAASSNSGVIKAAANLNATGTFWSAQSGGSQYTDLIDPNNAGVAITGVSTDANGRPKVFQGPDGVSEGWLDFGAGRFKVTATESLDTVLTGPSAARTAIEGVTGNAKIVYVSPSGNDSASGKTWGSAKATLAAALTAIGAGNDGVIMLDFGVHEVGNGLSLSGYRVVIKGQGAGHLDTGGGVATRTVIRASTQTGPVLDFTGYLPPTSFAGKVSIGEFAIEGSGATDATKGNAGIKVGYGAAVGSMRFHDIAIAKTGGPGMDIGYAYLCDFERIVVVTPAGAKANDVPYFNIYGANGNRFYGIGLRSLTSSADVGVSGALVVKPTADYSPTANAFIAPWIEFLHVPTNGCLISVQGNANTFTDVQGFDCSKETGATGTAFARFLAPVVTPGPIATPVNSGMNVWRGVVPGNGGTATSFDLGLDVQQSRNAIIGPKGYKGTNVQIASGVTGTYVELTGAESSATDPAVIDNSGNVSNVYLDNFSDLRTFTNYSQSSRTTGAAVAAGPQFMDRGNNANGAVWVGNAGAGYRAAGSSPVFIGDNVTFRQVSGATTMQFVMDNSFRPGLQFPSHGGTLPGASSSIRGKLSAMQGATGVADQFWFCRKKNDDTYEWTQLTTTNLVTKTASYTLLATDNIAVFNGASLTASLPDPTTVPVGQQYKVKNINASSLTVNSAGTSKTIDGAASVSLAQWAAGRYVSDGTQWLGV